MKEKKFILGLALFWLVAFPLMFVNIAQAETINVPGDHSTIQAAINAAITGDEILVAASGVPYVENIIFDGTKTITLITTDGAIIDGSAGGSVVSFYNGDDSNLDGFKLINGSGSANHLGYASGGGISCFSASPTVINCKIDNNSAVYGAGIYLYESSSATISNCVITNNTTTSNGGGGIICWKSSPTIIDCTIDKNSAVKSGGGIICRESSSPTINNCKIRNNSANIHGGGIRCKIDSSPTITNCTISGNQAGDEGGGIRVDDSSVPTITNCVIYNNTSQNGGGGISCGESAAPTIANCTISDNESSERGGGIRCHSSSSPIVISSILWSNTDILGDNEIHLGGSSSINITYSDIKGGWDGTGNISGNPLFDADYHLTTGSPCIDAANSDSPAPAFDKDGGSRIDDPATTPNTGAGTYDYYDMGAYEYHTCPIYVPDDYPTIQGAINGARDGCEVIVRDGTYQENINFLGKAITVRSENGADSTTIDGTHSGSVVTFSSNEGPGTVLNGFTITNGSSSVGGGIFCIDSSPSITNCFIIGNISTGSGGGIYCLSASPMITNCLLIGNAASLNGGGINCSQFSFPDIINCTFYDNSALDGGGIYASSGAIPIVMNTILWEDTAIAVTGDDEIGLNVNSDIYITYSDIQGGYDGTKNINIPPLFAGEAFDLYNLQPLSPCIDAANSDSPALFTDILGNSRYDDPDTEPNNGTGANGSHYDIGAYEYRVLDCSTSEQLVFGSSNAYTGDTGNSPNNIIKYGCSNWNESGPEVVHTITTTQSGNLTASLSNMSEDVDLDVFIVTPSCDANDCKEAGEIAATYLNAPPGEYLIVVDGYYGSSGAYTLTVDYDKPDCSDPVQLELGRPHSGNTNAGVNNVSKYTCADWEESGPEIVHTITTTKTADLTAILSNLEVDPDTGLEIDLDVFILLPSECNESSCLAIEDLSATYNTATYHNAPPGEYYIVVDGYQGDSGGYTLTVNHNELDCVTPDTVSLEFGAPYSGDTSDSYSNVNEYGCTYWEEIGPEVVHTISIDQNCDFSAALSGLSEGVDLDVFILSTQSGCDANTCEEYGDNSAIYLDAPVGTYNVVVDGYYGSSGAYNLTMNNIFYRDADGDGYGDPQIPTEPCVIPADGFNYVTNNADCNDDPNSGGADINQDAAEVCDGQDNDCDGKTDDFCGNVDDNDCIDIVDVLCLYQWVIGNPDNCLKNVYVPSCNSCDVDGSGSVDIMDVLCLNRRVLGNPSCLDSADVPTCN